MKEETPSQRCLREAIEKLQSEIIPDSWVIKCMKERDPEGIVKMDDYYEEHYGTRPYGTERRKS